MPVERPNRPIDQQQTSSIPPNTTNSPPGRVPFPERVNKSTPFNFGRITRWFSGLFDAISRATASIFGRSNPLVQIQRPIASRIIGAIDLTSSSIKPIDTLNQAEVQRFYEDIKESGDILIMMSKAVDPTHPESKPQPLTPPRELKQYEPTLYLIKYNDTTGATKHLQIEILNQDGRYKLFGITEAQFKAASG